jgi:hypothetical protein
LSKSCKLSFGVWSNLATFARIFDIIFFLKIVSWQFCTNLPQKEMLLFSKCLSGLIMNSNNWFLMDSCHKRPTSLFEILINSVRIKMVLQLFFKCLFKKTIWNWGIIWLTPPKFIERLKCKSQSENNKRKRSWGMLITL